MFPGLIDLRGRMTVGFQGLHLHTLPIVETEIAAVDSFTTRGGQGRRQTDEGGDAKREVVKRVVPDCRWLRRSRPSRMDLCHF
jgi:hypothetical protein